MPRGILLNINTRTEEPQLIIVSLILSQLLTDKKYQYQNLPVRFDADFNQNGNFGIINVEISAFKRMISNLINNAVDAFEGKNGIVTLKLIVNKAQIKIIIQDNGKGMPKLVVDKILNGIGVTANKENGHGIGMVQVSETLKRNNGHLDVDSEISKGTKIMLTFPRRSVPAWFAEKIQFKKNDTIIILDDDESIHSAWEVRLKDYATDIYIKHFTKGIDAINFINNAASKDKILLLSDFELLKQELNGLYVIEHTAIERSILVTSHYANQVVRDLAAKSGTKILPKQLASEVPIQLENDIESKCKKVDLVIIDDNQMFADSLALLFSDKVVDVYYGPKQFLKNLPKYAKNTIICTDNDLSHSIDGITLAKQLHEAGYTNLYILSGKDFKREEVPDYLTVINKTDIESIKKCIF